MPDITSLPVLLLAPLFLMNLIAFSVVGYDKHLSRQRGKSNRISEGALFFLAAAYGSAGLYLAMLLFRHKTKKWYFTLGVPLLMLQNIAIMYVLYTYITAAY